ncbi:MAG: hypothetical protein ACMUIS_12730, partial [bacterium]
LKYDYIFRANAHATSCRHEACKSIFGAKTDNSRPDPNSPIPLAKKRLFSLPVDFTALTTFRFSGAGQSVVFFSLPDP